MRATYLALAAIDTWLSGFHGRWARLARLFTKPLLMPTLAAHTWRHSEGSPLRASTIAAQTAGWAGDVALLSDRPAAFRVGSSCFGIGHLAYISGFLYHRGGASAGPAKRVVAGWAVTAPITTYHASREDPALGAQLGAYSGVLAAMAASATQVGRQLPPEARRFTMVGAGLFLLSDSLLGMRRFVLDDPPHWLERAVMATYTGAQYCLAEGAIRAS